VYWVGQELMGEAGWTRRPLFLRRRIHFLWKAAQEAVKRCCEDGSESVDLLDFLHGGFSQAGNAAEVLHERGSPGFPHAGELIEDRFPDLPAAQVGVEGIGEAMGFIPDALEELNCGIIERETQGWSLIGEDNGLTLFGQADEGRWLKVEHKKGPEGGADLPFSSVDHHEIGKWASFVCQSLVAPSDNFFHCAEVIVSNKGFDPVAPVVGLAGFAVAEADHGGDDE